MTMTRSLNRSHLLAIVIALLIVLWVLSGGAPDADSTERSLTPESTAFTVGYKTLQPESKAHSVRISAHVAANRTVDVVAEVSGKVTEIRKSRGSQVNKGDLILKIDQRDLPERLKQAQAQLKRRQLETESTRNLFKRDLTNQSAVVLAESELAEAEAALTAIRLDLEATEIRAPFDGIYDQRYVEAGEYVSPGKSLIRVIDNRTMLVKGAVSENIIRSVEAGTPAYALLTDGTRIDGTLTFVASSASPETRTYPVEMKVAQPDSRLFDGQTATLYIPQGTHDAYEISPALLIVNDQGGLGLKVLDEEDRVQVVDVSILEAGTTGIWIIGPHGELRLITSGQGFVPDGTQVNAVDTGTSQKKAPADASAEETNSDKKAADQ